MKLNNFYIYAENFYNFDIERLDLKYLSKYFNVKVFYFNKKLKIRKKSKIKFFYCKNRKKFTYYLKKKSSKQSFILFANYNNINFLYSLIKQCQKIKIKIIEISKTNLTPGHKLDFLLDFRFLIIKKIIFFYKLFFNFLLNKKLVSDYINCIDYSLFSGAFSEKIILNQKAKKIATFSRDYQIFKNLNKKSNINVKYSNYAAFIDDGVGSHIDEKILKINIDKKKLSLYYKELEFFLSKLNKITTVTICPHPKCYVEKKRFKQNYVSKKKTIDVIKDSNFVIGTTSTALGLAVLLNKPILLITSKNYPIPYHKIEIKKWNKTLGARLIDISKEYEISNFNNLKINRALYKKYIFEFHCNYKVLHKNIWDPFLKEIKIK